MPNKTIYVRDCDLPLWDRAQKELGESISSAFVDYLKTRLEAESKRRKRGKLDMVQAMDGLLAEINAATNLDIERHPFWSPMILDANSVNIGYKLHQRRANPDRIMSLVVHPLDFDEDGQLNSHIRDRIVAEVEKFWDGKSTERHRLADTTRPQGRCFMPERRAFQELAQEVSDLFADHDKAENFIRMLEQTGIKIRDFDGALDHLPGPGGAFERGQRFPTKYEFHNALDDAEKSELKELYRACVNRLEQEFPDLRKGYFVVFDR